MEINQRTEHVNHFSHVHPLKLEPAAFPYYCSGCNQQGFGSTYTCQSCNFFLHEECATASSRVNHPFSEKCKLELHHKGTGHGSSLCNACGQKVKGYHYKCLCTFQKRNLHPFCLKYNHSLEAADGLTLCLNKTATTRCQHCHKKDLRNSVYGWAYVSSCDKYCYHVTCVREIVIDNWRKGFLTGQLDPYQAIKESLPKLDKMDQIVRERKVQGTMKKTTAADK